METRKLNYPTARELAFFLSNLPEEQKDMPIAIARHQEMIRYPNEYLVLRFEHWDIILLPLNQDIIF